LHVERQGGAPVIRFSGRWVIEEAAQLERALDRLMPEAAAHLMLDATAISEIDLTGAALIGTRVQRLAQSGTLLQWQGEVPSQLRFVSERLESEPAPVTEESISLDFVEPVRTVGRWAIERARSLTVTVGHLGRIGSILIRALTNFRHLRVHALVRHVYETGIQAIPIVSLIAFLISVIVAYMGAQQLRKFGAEIFVVDLVTVGVLREMGVLLTAIIVAGRSGSAFAAEIGVMKLNDEVDALQAIGTDPVEVLVLPRVLGLMIALPLLTILADTVGLTGGGLLCYWLLDISPAQYVSRVQESIASTTFWVGIIKAPVFAFLIAFVGTLRGLQVRDSSRELGRLTTEAVVESIFLVILADALFAVLFMELDL
jgi:phospholipid/cholesterol/gamma-HCH transport system permease protein